jgi:hypothetical protein
VNSPQGRRQAVNRSEGGQGALIAAFRDGLGLAGIAHTKTPGGIRFAAVGPDSVAGLAAGECGDVVFWCRRAADAERIIASANAKLRRESFPPDPCAVLVAAAARWQVPLYSPEEISDEAAAAIARVENELESLQRAGALKSVNRSYKDYRQNASARGEKIVPYVAWFNKYKENLVRQLAAALRYF